MLVSILEAWMSTHEKYKIDTSTVQLRYFGQEDRIRINGRDARNRIHDADFDVQKFRATPEDCLCVGVMLALATRNAF